MARVPTYEELRVAPRPVAGPTQSGVSPDAFGYAARQQGAEAAALDKASDVGVNIAVKMQEREDTDMLLRAETAFHDELLAFETEAKKRKGADAKGLTAEADGFFTKARERYVQGLANDRQRQAFLQRLEPTRRSTLRTISGFEEKERADSFLKASEARTNVAIRTAAGNAHDWEIVGAQRAEIERQARAVQAERRWTPEQYQDYLDSKLTAFHKEVMQALTSKPETRALAKKYFEKFEKDIPGDVRAELGKQAVEAGQKAAVMAAVDEVVKGAKFETDRRAPIQLNTLEGQLREKFKNDPDGYTMASAQLRSRVAAVKDERAQETNALEAGVANLLLNKVPPMKALDSPEMARLSAADPEKANSWRLHLMREAESAANRAAALAAKDYTNLKRQEEMFWRNNFVAYQNLWDPARIAAEPSRDRFIAEAAKFGPEKGSQLIARYDAFHADGKKLVAATIDKQLFEAVADRAGLKPFDPKKDENERRELAVLQMRVEAIIDQEQRKAGNKELTREAKEAIMKREIANEVIVKGRLYGADVKPVFKLREGEEARIAVPTAFAQALKRRGLSEAAIRQEWLDASPQEKAQYKEWKPR